MEIYIISRFFPLIILLLILFNIILSFNIKKINEGNGLVIITGHGNQQGRYPTIFLEDNDEFELFDWQNLLFQFPISSFNYYLFHFQII